MCIRTVNNLTEGTEDKGSQKENSDKDLSSMYPFMSIFPTVENATLVHVINHDLFLNLK